MNLAPTIPISTAEETVRLQALQPYKDLAFSQNPVFEQIAHLTARLFAMPIALVSLVDAEVVMYPGNAGNPEMGNTLHRGDAICSLAIYLTDAATVFPDMLAVPCPWISTEAHGDLAFYASYPLQTADKKPVGTLCLLDRKPHEFSASEQALLKRMADIAMSLLNLELLVTPAESPAIWQALQNRIQLSLQRVETLTALIEFEESRHTPAALAYRASMQEERLLIARDLEFQVKISFERLGR